MDHLELGRLLRRWREADGRSIRRLGADAEVNAGTISWAERGDPGRGRLSVEAVRLLDTALGADGELIRAHRTLPPRRAAAAEPEPDLLPPAPSPFVDRHDVLATIRAALDPPHPLGSARVVLVTGPGGIGKTGAALHAAHLLRHHFSGALYADLRGWAGGTAGPRTQASVLRSWCRALGAAAGDLGGDDDELGETWHRLAGRRRLLVVADNARPDQIRPLIPSRADSVVLVTSRDRRVTADGARRVELGPLLDEHAARLLTDRTGWPADSVVPLLGACGGWPLALVLAAQEAAHHWTPGEAHDMARDLSESDELDAIDRTIRASYTTLAPDEQRTWRYLALVGDAVPDGQAAALLGEPARDVRRRCHRLVDAHLADRAERGWVLHDQLRAFALREGRRVDPEPERQAAVYRGLLWHLHGLAAAAPVLAGRDDTPHPLPDLPDGVEPPEFTDYAQALSHTEAHWSYPSNVATALAGGHTTLAWQILAAGISAAYVLSPLTTWDQAAHAILTSGHDLDDEGRGWCEHARGVAAGTAGEPDRALRHLLTAAELRRGLGDDHRRDLGWSCLNAGRFALDAGRSDDDITPLIEEGSRVHGDIGWTAGLALAAALRGALAERRGDPDAAVAHYDETLAHNIADPAITTWARTALAAALLRVSPPQPDRARHIAEDAEHHAHLAGLTWGRISALIVLADTTPHDGRIPLSTAAELAATIADPREASIRERLELLD